MGYYTRFTGSISIDPPLQYNEFKDISLDRYSIKLDIEEFKKETETGEEIIKQAGAIIPLSDESYKGYSILEDLKSLIFLFQKNHKFVGELRGEGEEASDIRRYVIRYSKDEPTVLEWYPEIVWPDGKKESRNV